MRGSTEKWCHRRRAFQKGFGELTDDVRVVGAIVNVVLLGPSLQAKRRGTGLKPSAENRPGDSQIPRIPFSCCDFFCIEWRRLAMHVSGEITASSAPLASAQPPLQLLRTMLRKEDGQIRRARP